MGSGPSLLAYLSPGCEPCLRIGDHDLSESDGFGASRITLLQRGCQVLT